MPDLSIRFVCANPVERAEEFQHHLINLKTIPARVEHEVEGDDIWLRYKAITGNTVNRIINEARPWSLDRGLSLMQSSDESGGSETVLMIADLARVVD